MCLHVKTRNKASNLKQQAMALKSRPLKRLLFRFWRRYMLIETTRYEFQFSQVLERLNQFYKLELSQV